MKAFRILCLVPVLSLISAMAFAADYKVGSLEISQPWTRATAGTAPTGAGFLTITNKGTAPDRLVSVRSSAANQSEIHEMKMDGNVMRMRELDGGLAIAPGATVALAPGGFHVMMMGLKAPFKEGTSIPLTLVFEKAGSIDVALSVKGLGATKP